MPRYREPQLPETGQLLGRSLLGVYLDNDRYFHGLGDRQRSIPRACYEGGLSSGQSEGNIWSGYHFFRSDAGGLEYYMKYAGSSGRLKLYYGTDTESEAHKIDEATPGQTKSTTGFGGTTEPFDLTSISGVTAGDLYRVIFRITNGTPDDPNYGTLIPPYTEYSGDEYYRGTPEIYDYQQSAASHFSKWYYNDRFFWVCRPPNPAFSSTTGEDIYRDTFWNGYFQYVDGIDTLYYYMSFTSNDTNNPGDGMIRLSTSNLAGADIEYNVAQCYPISETTETVEDSIALTAASYNVGDWYRVRADIYHTSGDSSYDGTGIVYYCYIGATASAADFQDMGTLTVAQPVYGNTINQDTALQYLSSNDRSIVRRLKRKDWAVRSHDEDYRIVRRYDTLYFRGSEIEMSYGNSRKLQLDEYDGEYGTLDLHSVDQLHYGTTYTLSGGTLEYAMEW